VAGRCRRRMSKTHLKLGSPTGKRDMTGKRKGERIATSKERRDQRNVGTIVTVFRKSVIEKKVPAVGT